jgi:hypothetical protein
VVSGVTQLLDQSIWNPESFLKDFGDIKNDLINCLTGNTVPNQPMKKFWEGFERLTKRLKDEKGQPMLLKLKVCIHLREKFLTIGRQFIYLFFMYRTGLLVMISPSCCQLDSVT